MAFTAKWITAAGTLTLSDGAPYKIESGIGMGAAEVRNLYERGPQQDGVSDLGYRIDPRTVTLGVNFAGTSASQLDSLRGSLQYHFAPRAALGTLQITRDDGGVRELYARRTGPLDMPLVREHRPGNLHKTAVQVFAPNPVWTGSGASAGPGAAGTVLNVTTGAGTRSIVYQGDVPEYPIIALRGPIVNAVITNVTTGKVLTFVGTIGSGAVYTIDLRYGRKTVVNHLGTNLIAELSDASDLATWRLEPAPVAAGGTNVIVVAGATSDGGGTITYTSRFVSW
jgi:hypothetical protein